jgi:polyhydroxyalkanoate synthesis regulator phasin/ribosomal protein L32
MVDMAMISGAMSALKAAADTTKLMIASHDASVIRQKAIELQAQIFTAQQNALAAQSDQFALLEQIRELEKQIANLEAWDTEKQRYELKRLASGGVVYSLKEDASGGEPPHQICAACYQHGKKSILQKVPGNIARSHLGMPSTSRCPNCKDEVIN